MEFGTFAVDEMFAIDGIWHGWDDHHWLEPNTLSVARNGHLIYNLCQGHAKKV